MVDIKIDIHVGVKGRGVGWLMYLIQPHLRVGLEGPSVQGIGDLPPVLRLAHHVLESRPRDRSVVQVLLQEENAGGEVAVVVLVGDTPTEGSELSSFLHHRVHEAESEEQLAPLGRVRVYTLQPILIHNDGIGFQDACFEAGGRLVGDLGGHLQQAEGEGLVWQRGDEQPEVGVHALFEPL